MGETEFWNDQKRAQKTITELKVIRAMIDPIEALEKEHADAAVGLELAREAGDKELLEEVDATLHSLVAKMERIELQSLLSDKHDHRHCFFSIQAGVGGTEANDWAQMLERMYLYYWDSMGFKIEEMSRTFGTEAGIAEVSYAIRGPFAYGYSSCECGSHRLARVSPFNAEGKRQTSFATVDVTPEFEDSEIDVPDRDVEITPFVRASGPGGQNVNKVASAIRIVHLPTGIQVVANTFRDQSQNKKQALAVLMSKLEQIAQEKRENEIAEAKGGRVERGWGTQIRSYVFYDNRVKDHRTNYEEPNPQNVLSGNIRAFVDAELKRRRRERDSMTTAMA
ncbi:MAG: peptide chain release factor 2 [Phycisphaerales bacterium]|nr:peptide chain release factor 2 [Phycisphaerales bacterium]